MNIPNIQSAWTTYKSHEATLISDLQNLVNTDLTNIEKDRAALAAAGATDLVELIQRRISSLLADLLPAGTVVDPVSGNTVSPVMIFKVQAPAGAPVTLSVSGHVSAPPPVTQTASGQLANLS
jgi:hypothetical protein